MKVFGRLLANQLAEYLENYELLNRIQFDLQSKKSSTDIALYFILKNEHIDNRGFLTNRKHFVKMWIDFSEKITLNFSFLKETVLESLFLIFVNNFQKAGR